MMEARQIISRNRNHLSHYKSVSLNQPTTRHLLLAIALFFICLPFLGSLTASEPVATYGVSFEQAANHYVNVRMEFVPTESESVTLYMPVWTPGSYLVREYSRNVDQFHVVDEQGAELSFAKVSKNEWKIDFAEAKKLIVSYRVYCNEMSVRTNFVDSEFAILNGAATFLTNDRLRDQPAELQVSLPGMWKRSVTSLAKAARGEAHRYSASNFDELVDSPLLVGNPTLHPFEVGGVQHYLVNQGGDQLWDGDRAAADVQKIVAEHQDMWGTTPYDRYYFLNIISESGGGLEHDNSTLLMTSRWSYRAPRSYQRWLGLVSHEFFHAWNVRRLRPAALKRYDYLGENYFDELWVAEGVTSYYDDLALRRAQITSRSDYLSSLSRQIKTLQQTPGRNQQSLQMSSHDTWIKFYRPDENSNNSSISYYNKGAVVAFLLDAEIRRATDGEQSLDDCMRALYESFSEGDEGYTNADVLRITEEITGEQFDAWFESAIDSTDELDYQPALEWFGLQFKRPKTKAGAEPEEPKIWLGASTSSGDGQLTISRIADHSPAAKAGLNVGDELIAINEYRLSGGLDGRLEQYSVDDTVEVLISRRGKLYRMAVQLSADPRQSWELQIVDEPSEEQKRRLVEWLHMEIEAEGETEAESNGPSRGDAAETTAASNP